MRTFTLSFAAILTIFIMLSLHPPGAEAKCTVCHSKNPKMVRMHKALEFKGCFNCHFNDRIAKPNEMPRQMRTDPLCKDCHATGPLPDTEELKKLSTSERGPIP
jgi:hypothetical protein